MQKRTIINILAFLFLAISTQSFAQVRTTNENGEEIIRYSDGTWKYANETASLSETDSRKKVQKLAITARRNEAQKIKAEKITKLEYDRLKTKITYTTDSEEKALLKTQMKAMKSRVKEAKSARKKASKDARFYEKLVTMPLEKRELTLAKKLEKEAVAGRKAERESLGLEAEDKIAEVKVKKPRVKKQKNNDLSEVEKPKRKKVRKPKVKKPKKQRGDKIASNRLPRASKAPKVPGVLTRMDKINLAEKRQKELSKKYTFPITDYAAQKDCRFAFNEKDEFTGESKKGLESRLFFTNTDEALVPFMNGEDFMVCEGYLAQVSGGRIVLSLKYTMKSVDANKQYGRLDEGAALKLKLLDGTNISLWNNNEDRGFINKRKQTTVYQAFYNISQVNAKKLSKSEVSKARVVWGSGYDSYEIYELDFFKDQLACFNL